MDFLCAKRLSEIARDGGVPEKTDPRRWSGIFYKARENRSSEWEDRMNKVILAYNFTAERLPLLRQVCMMLRVNCKAVPQEEMNDAVGFLAGLKDCAKEAVNPLANEEAQLQKALEEAAEKAGEDPAEVKKAAVQLLMQAAQKEMVFLCGFDMHLLNRFLAALKRSKLKEVELKAMLTVNNRQWSGRHLLQELAAEHVYMQHFKKNMHQKETAK